MAVSAAILSFIHCHWNVLGVTLAILRWHLELPLLPLDTGESNAFNQWERRKANRDSVKRILIGQRALESGKWKLEVSQYQQ
jgi:hypothetical protein